MKILLMLNVNPSHQKNKAEEVTSSNIIIKTPRTDSRGFSLMTG